MYVDDAVEGDTGVDLSDIMMLVSNHFAQSVTYSTLDLEENSSPNSAYRPTTAKNAIDRFVMIGTII